MSDTSGSHHYSGRTARRDQSRPGRHRRRSPWSALAGRATVVAGTTATALLAVLPTAPASTAPTSTAPASTAPAPRVVTPARTTAGAPLLAPTRRVDLAAVVAPQARFDVRAALATAAPAALRASAMQKALGKIGARYRYGASGPTAFDCSGLVSWAYRSSGRTLPRSSAAMSHVGTPVARSALQPGDLVFFYRGPSHVGIYVGNGQIVHASNPAHPVKLAALGSMPFASARRV